jgi:hypothetical protein
MLDMIILTSDIQAIQLSFVFLNDNGFKRSLPQFKQPRIDLKERNDWHLLHDVWMMTGQL